MRYTWMGLIGWLLAGMMTVSAESAAVKGLGTFPFSSRIEVTAGSEAAAGNFFSGKDKENRREIAKIICKSAVPPGVHLYTEEGTFPYDLLRLYQLRTEDMQGEYAAFLFVLSGEERELFPHRNKKVISFWNQAFYEDGKKPEFLFGIPKISLAEYQAEWEQFLQKEKIKDIKVKISDISPWHRYKNKDGSYRWSQECRLLISRNGQGVVPLWVDSHFYKAGHVYYLITAVGSHMAGNKLGGYVLYGADGLEREMT